MSLPTTNRVQVPTTFAEDRHTFLVFLSDAETQVVANKAKKAGISINEYIRNASLGFPMG